MQKRLAIILFVFLLTYSCQHNENSKSSNSESSLPNAETITFTDIDLGAGEIAGILTIEKADDESEITTYQLMWGSNETEEIDDDALIDEFAATGSNIEYRFEPDTSIPSGATHFLVHSKGNDAQSAEPTSLAFVDETETEYTSSEGTKTNPIVVVVDEGFSKSYNKQIGQGISYYTYDPCCSFTSVDISELEDDLDLIKYTDASFDSIAEQSALGRLTAEGIPGDGSADVYFAVDGSKSGHKLNGAGSAFTLTLTSHNGATTSYHNEGSTENPKDISRSIKERFYYSGQTGADGTSYYESEVITGNRYTVNVPTADKIKNVFSDHFETEVTTPYVAESDALFVSVGSSAQGSFTLEILTAEGNETFPIYLHPDRDNYCQVNDTSSYYSFDVSSSSSYTATIASIQAGNDVDLYVYNDGTFTSLAGFSSNPGTDDETVVFTTESDRVTIRVDDVSGNGASFVLKLEKN